MEGVTFGYETNIDFFLAGESEKFCGQTLNKIK